VITSYERYEFHVVRCCGFCAVFDTLAAAEVCLSEHVAQQHLPVVADLEREERS